MRRKITLALSVLLVFAVFFTGCGKETAPGSPEEQIAALQAENAQLRSQIEVLTRQLEDSQKGVLTDWTLSVSPSEDRSFATLQFTGIANTELEGQTLYLVVTLNDLEVDSWVCEKDGDGYSATIELPAADGYGYYCLMVSDSGSQQKIPLVTPETDPSDPRVNLSSGISAYCVLTLPDFTMQDGTLTLNAGFAQAQMPALFADGSSTTVDEAYLLFMHNGKELERKAVTLAPGEAEGTFEASVAGFTFTVPAATGEEQLDLMLVVSLSSGDDISHIGCSWYASNGAWEAVLG